MAAGGDDWGNYANIKGTYYNRGNSNLNVDDMVTTISEALRSGIPVYFYSGYGSSAGRHAVDLLGVLDNGKILMYNPAGTAASAYNIKNGVGNMYEYGDSNILEENVRTIVSGTSPSLYGGGTNWVIGYFIPDESPSGKKKQNLPKPYVGYDGNEAVVSPVTGILLEYGVYGDEKEEEKDERTNTDIKNGVYVAETNRNIALESPEGTDVVDKVGYAKIMLLNPEYYKKLEAHTNCWWKNDSLVNNNGKTYRDDIQSTDELDDENKWNTLNQTVYGYKEFGENYADGGIAGNIIYIDGFICEDVDTENINSSKKIEEQIPSGKTISIESFKTPIGEIGENEEQRESLFMVDEDYNSISKAHTEKIKVENRLKKAACSSFYINDGTEDIIFIKEGTVLGRTMTDKELLEKIRNGSMGTYDEIRKKDKGQTTGQTIQGANPNDEEENEERVIGNYLRIIFKDDEDNIIENVEDYMKLDEAVKNKKGKFEDLMYWQAKEAEGFEFVIDGVESYALAITNGKARSDNPADKYGHNYYIDGAANNDINLCPGMCFQPSLTENIEVFKEVTGGKDPTVGAGDCSVYCTGEELLDIYQQLLEMEIKTLKDEFPALQDLDDEDTRIFGLIDVMYAGIGNFELGTIAGKLRAGDLDLTLDDFLSNAVPANTFYSQNPEGLIRRRAMDYYIYAEGKYGCDLYDKKEMGTEIEERYDIFSETPFQDLMVDKEGAERVPF